MQKIRLLLLDDHVLFREGLSRLLASEPQFQMAGQCGSSSEALAILGRSPVDLVLVDYDLGEDHGSHFISAARDAGYSGRFLMLTAGMTATESSIALRLGASGIFLKHNSPSLLAKAIRLVAEGDMWVDPKVIQSMAEGVRQSDEASIHKPLTGREQDVLRGIFEGLSNKEIAAQLGISEGSVKAALQQLFEKTRVRTRSQLVRIALETSLTNPKRT